MRITLRRVLQEEPSMAMARVPEKPYATLPDPPMIQLRHLIWASMNHRRARENVTVSRSKSPRLARKIVISRQFQIFTSCIKICSSRTWKMRLLLQVKKSCSCARSYSFVISKYSTCGNRTLISDLKCSATGAWSQRIKSKKTYPMMISQKLKKALKIISTRCLEQFFIVLALKKKFKELEWLSLFHHSQRA